MSGAWEWTVGVGGGGTTSSSSDDSSCVSSDRENRGHRRSNVGVGDKKLGMGDDGNFADGRDVLRKRSDRNLLARRNGSNPSLSSSLGAEGGSCSGSFSFEGDEDVATAMARDVDRVLAEEGWNDGNGGDDSRAFEKDLIDVPSFSAGGTSHLPPRHKLSRNRRGDVVVGDDGNGGDGDDVSPVRSSSASIDAPAVRIGKPQRRRSHHHNTHSHPHHHHSPRRSIGAAPSDLPRRPQEGRIFRRRRSSLSVATKCPSAIVALVVVLAVVGIFVFTAEVARDGGLSSRPNDETAALSWPSFAAGGVRTATVSDAEISIDDANGIGRGMGIGWKSSEWRDRSNTFSSSPNAHGGDGPTRDESHGFRGGKAFDGRPTSMLDERKRIRGATRRRAEKRRARTKPPPPADAASSDDAGGERAESSSPKLTLDLPMHRALAYDRERDASHRNPRGEGPSENSADQRVRRRQLAVAASPAASSDPCGTHAQNAASRHPDHYPKKLNVNAQSRVVVTGALSSPLGMELILRLHSQCGVRWIMGVEQAYPNTRHDRIEMVEHRYKYVKERVPGFQRLFVPVFGLHPHPKMESEARREAEGGPLNVVKRFQPTHIVHLSSTEEGRDEHVDYGDVTNVSPYTTHDDGRRSMMRRFDSLISMQQLMDALASVRDPSRRPRLVYVTSDEARDRSGVVFAFPPNDGGSESVHGSNGASDAVPQPATVYGTSSLLKEILASTYRKHWSVDSVGLRVPMLLGPFARSGSVVNDLAERTVQRAVGNGPGVVRKRRVSRDRHELGNIWMKREGAALGASDRLAFASDVVGPVLAAMQYRDPTATDEMPSLFRLGSKYVTSMKDLEKRMAEYLPPNEGAEGHNGTDRRQLDDDVEALSVTIRDERAPSDRDVERNQDLLGWSHTTRLHEGTKAMLAWHILKAYPYGLPPTVPAYSALKSIVDDSRDMSPSLSELPCASGCRWSGFCSTSPWDEVMKTSRGLTSSCKYVLYTVDLRAEFDFFEKHSAGSQRPGWESRFCKVAFVSSSSELAKSLYGSVNKDGVPNSSWNGKKKERVWRVIEVPGSQYSMSEAQLSLAKISPNLLFGESVVKAMYINHRKVGLSTDQATGVMQHMEMSARDFTKRKTVPIDGKQTKLYLPPRSKRRSVFFTSKYSFPADFDMNKALNLANFVRHHAGVAETKDIRSQLAFYEQSGHLTRTNVQRSPNYQESFQDNDFHYFFLKSTWLVHELKSEEGRNLRCEMYEEHASWGNSDMEDMSMGFVMAKRSVKMQLGETTAPEYEGPEEWQPMLVPKEPDEKGAFTDEPVYLDYLNTAQKVATDEKGAEFYVSFLPRKVTM